jgi:hypothetical protein
MEEVEAIMGKDPWIHGIIENSAALNKFLDFSYAQGLLSKKPRLDQLFVDVTHQ